MTPLVAGSSRRQESNPQAGWVMSVTAQTISRAVLLAAAAAALVAAAAQLREKRTLADQTVADLEDQIAALDPATRAAVVGRLTSDAAKQAKARIDR
jgi:hypothetical protein